MAREHWLLRLSAKDWLKAAERELELAQTQSRSRRKALTHVRRGVGMALNGVLVASHTAEEIDLEHAESVWGRSYIDHIKALRGEVASDAPIPSRLVPAAVRQAADELMALPLVDSQGLVRLGPGHSPEVEANLRQGGLMLDWAKAYTQARDPDLATL